MKRSQLFEFTDQPWYPQVFRGIQTDYLQFVTTLGSGHKNLVPLMVKAMQHAGTNRILDLCSGGAGPWIQLHEEFERAGYPVTVQLSDKYPHSNASRKWNGAAGRGIEYLAEPVDALRVPPHLKGMRTMFEGFHHFKPEQARSILQNAMENRAAIGIFEAALKPPLAPILLLLSPLMTLAGYLSFTPFIKPLTWSRLLWTYLLPLVPLATCWDGVVSFLRGYSVHDLEELTEAIRSPDYVWEAGQASTGTPVFVFTYLIGYPVGVEEISP